MPALVVFLFLTYFCNHKSLFIVYLNTLQSKQLIPLKFYPGRHTQEHTGAVYEGCVSSEGGPIDKKWMAGATS